MATDETKFRRINAHAQGQSHDAWPLDQGSLTTAQGPSKRRFGPQTPEGLARCAAVRTKHGRDTKVMRDQRRMISAALRLVEDQMYADGLISGPKRVGRKPGPLARPDKVWTFIKGLRRQPPPGGESRQGFEIFERFLKGCFPKTTRSLSGCGPWAGIHWHSVVFELFDRPAVDG